MPKIILPNASTYVKHKTKDFSSFLKLFLPLPGHATAERFTGHPVQDFTQRGAK